MRTPQLFIFKKIKPREKYSEHPHILNLKSLINILPHFLTFLFFLFFFFLMNHFCSDILSPNTLGYIFLNQGQCPTMPLSYPRNLIIYSYLTQCPYSNFTNHSNYILYKLFALFQAPIRIQILHMAVLPWSKFYFPEISNQISPSLPLKYRPNLFLFTTLPSLPLTWITSIDMAATQRQLTINLKIQLYYLRLKFPCLNTFNTIPLLTKYRLSSLVLNLTFKNLHNLAAQYISNLLLYYSPPQDLSLSCPLPGIPFLTYRNNNHS